MLANLSAVLLYYYCVNNNIDLPIIIPLFLGFRSFELFAFDNNNIFLKTSFLQNKTMSDIEYITSIIVSAMVIIYLHYHDKLGDYKNYLLYLIWIIIVLYIILLIINFIHNISP